MMGNGYSRGPLPWFGAQQTNGGTQTLVARARWVIADCCGKRRRKDECDVTTAALYVCRERCGCKR